MRADNICNRGWAGSRAGLDGCEKISSSPPGFDPRTVQPVASHYTHRDMAAQTYLWHRTITMPYNVKKLSSNQSVDVGLRTDAVSKPSLNTDDTLPSPDADTLQWRKGLSFEIRDTWLRDGVGRGTRPGLHNHANLMFIHASVSACTAVRGRKDLCVHG